MRRMKRRFRKRTYKRRPFKRRRMMRNTRRANTPEVKYVDLHTYNIPMSIVDRNNPETCLGTISGQGNKGVSNAFGFIQQGAGPGQRVGSTIFVKSMNLVLTAKYCPNAAYRGTTDGEVIPTNAVMQVRVIWADNSQSVNVDTPRFWALGIPSTSGISAGLKRVNRREYQVWSDKTYVSRPFSMNSINLAQPLVNFQQSVPSLRFSQTILVNKRIVFNTATVIQDPKDDTMCYTLNVFPTAPAFDMMSNDTKHDYLRQQAYCYSYNLRIYYTDV